MVQGIEIDEIAICREAGIVLVFDVSAFDLVEAPVRALAFAARLVIAPVVQKLVADMAIIGNPQADIGVIAHCAVRFVSDPENIGRRLAGIELPIRDKLVSISNQ